MVKVRAYKLEAFSTFLFHHFTFAANGILFANLKRRLSSFRKGWTRERSALLLVFIAATVIRSIPGWMNAAWGNDFGIYYGSSPEIIPGSPDATESYTADGNYTKDITGSDGNSYYLAVTARTADPVESDLSEVVGPIIADATAPSEPTVYASTTF